MVWCGVCVVCERERGGERSHKARILKTNFPFSRSCSVKIRSEAMKYQVLSYTRITTPQSFIFAEFTYLV